MVLPCHVPGTGTGTVPRARPRSRVPYLTSTVLRVSDTACTSQSTVQAKLRCWIFKWDFFLCNKRWEVVWVVWVRRPQKRHVLCSAPPPPLRKVENHPLSAGNKCRDAFYCPIQRLAGGVCTIPGR
jgi:hypothetical protein